jgi:hypothetical protein
MCIAKGYTQFHHLLVHRGMHIFLIAHDVAHVIEVMSYMDTSSDVAPAIVVTSYIDTSSDVAHAIVVTSYMDVLSDVAHVLW